jgi:hypothetical protein
MAQRIFARRIRILALILATLPLLSACAQQAPLSDVRTSSEVLRLDEAGQALDISYRVGQPGKITITLEGEDGARYTLRDQQPRPAASSPYVLRFDGTAPGDADEPEIVRRRLPSGVYTYTVQLDAQPGATSRQSGTFRIESQDVPLPIIEGLRVLPTTISPNADAVDDVVSFNYRLPVTATVTIEFTSPDGSTTYPFVTRQEQGPQEQQHLWEGRGVDGSLLADGVYTYTITAEDRYGNITRRVGTLTVANGGEPEATITYAYIAPQQLLRGDVLTMTVRIKNTGDVPLRTYGPPSGYEYSTNDSFSSVENGRWADRGGGLWRIGLDWEGKGGYPFRWAISERPLEAWAEPGETDLLMPGEEVTVEGRVRIEQFENRMIFYVGLIREGVGYRQGGFRRTAVEVGLR